MAYFIKIQTKLNLILSLSVSLVLAVVSVLVYYQTKSALQTKAMHHKHNITIQLTESLSVPLWSFDTETVGKIVDATMQDDQVFSITVLDQDNNIFYHRIKDPRLEGLSPLPQNYESPFFIAKTILHHEKKVGSIQVLMSNKTILSELKSLVYEIILIVFTLELLLITILTFAIGKKCGLPYSIFSQPCSSY